MARLNIILKEGINRPFDPFDRFAQFRDNQGRTTAELLDEFRAKREANLDAIRRLNLKPADLDRTGMHPSLGVVTLGNLLSTWCAHDYVHIAQISRVLAKRHRDDIGPWLKYMRLLGGSG